jgi:dTDP-4-amino-4,6-dideoxygalactose transaminase
MNIPLVDLKRQYLSIKEEIDNAIFSVIHDTQFINGKYVAEFEQNFSSLLNVKHTLGVGNGTDALSIALKTLGVDSGDEVITVANSFIATSEAITTAGAKVVFADCNRATYNLDTKDLRAKITPRTKVIIPVHLYGQPADMTEIMNIAREHNLFVIEDAAQGVLAQHKEQNVGTFGDMATFSFYPGKNLGAFGDAGAIVTNNSELYKKAKMIANHGRIDKYDHEIEGENSRMDGIQGAVLNVKLRYIERWTQDRIEIAGKYRELLKDVGEIVLQETYPDVEHVYHLFVIRTSRRDGLLAHLKEKGIGAGIHYPIALHNLKAYKYLNYNPDDFPNANQFSTEVLSLPIFPELTDEEISFITSSLKQYFSKIS